MTHYHTPFAPPPVALPVRRQRNSGQLIVLAAVLLVAAALLATAYVLADRDHDAAAALLDTRAAELADVRGQIATTDTQRAAATQRVADLTDANAELSTCVAAVRHYLWDGLAGDDRDAALDTMFEVCQ
jgi:hypothetical protein